MADKEKKMMRRRLAGSYLSSVVSIALVLFLVGIAALLAGVAGGVSDYFKENLHVSVILKQDVDEDRAGAYVSGIMEEPCVRDARVITREEGTAQMKEMLGEDFLSVFPSSPIPVSVEVALNAGYVCTDSMEVVRASLDDPAVDEIDWQQSMIEALNTNIGKLTLVLGFFILLLLFISFVLIGNTVRLDVFARRFSIHTMKMVGATRAFIRRPFIGRAVLQGLAASLLGIAGVGAVAALAMKGMPQASAVLTPELLALTAAFLVLLGIVICVISTWFTVNKLVSLKRGQLYY